MTNDSIDFGMQLAMMPLELVMSIFGSQGASGGTRARSGSSTLGAATRAQSQAARVVSTVTHVSRPPPALPPTAQQRTVMPSKPAPVTTIGKRQSKAPTGGSTFVAPPPTGGAKPPVSRRARFK